MITDWLRYIKTTYEMLEATDGSPIDLLLTINENLSCPASYFSTFLWVVYISSWVAYRGSISNICGRQVANQLFVWNFHRERILHMFKNPNRYIFTDETYLFLIGLDRCRIGSQEMTSMVNKISSVLSLFFQKKNYLLSMDVR